MTLTDKTGAEVSVGKIEDAHAYAIKLADGPTVGTTFYLDNAGDRIFYHTEVAEEYEGRGLASVLIREALADSFNEGKVVVPVCPAVKGYAEKHPEELGGDVRMPSLADIEAVRAQL